MESIKKNAKLIISGAMVLASLIAISLNYSPSFMYAPMSLLQQTPAWSTIAIGSSLPSNVSRSGYNFFRTSDATLHISDGASWKRIGPGGSFETKGFTIENPTSSESIGLPFTFPYAITIDSVRAVVSGSTPSITFNVAHGVDMSSPSANLFSSGQTVTSTTTGSRLSTFSDNTIAASEWMKFTTSALSGTVSWVVVTMYYHRD